MRKPFSTQNEPWLSFSKQSESIFTDDFVHDNLLSVKLTQTSNRTTFNGKLEIKKKGDSHHKMEEQIKFWFPIWVQKNSYLYFKSKHNDIHLHYDHGIEENQGDGIFKFYNFYCGAKTNKQLNSLVLKSGINLLDKQTSIDSRLRVEISEQKTDLTTGHKMSWANDRWLIDFSKVLGWNNYNILSNALRIGYKQVENQFFFRAENSKPRALSFIDWTNLDAYFTKFIVNYIRKVDESTRLGIQVDLTKNSITKSSLLFHKSLANKQTGIKLKVSSDKRLAFCYQAILKKYGKWTFGFQMSDIGKSNKLQYGLQLDVNV